MKTVRLVLVVLGLMSGAALLVFWLLGWTEQVPSSAPVTISIGVMGLVWGLFTLDEAFSKTGPRGVGRLTAFAFGLGICTVGMAFLGHGWLTEHIHPAMLGAMAAAVVLGIIGIRSDGRRAEAARTALRRRGWLGACP
jgi:hypothetical protein